MSFFVTKPRRILNYRCQYLAYKDAGLSVSMAILGQQKKAATIDYDRHSRVSAKRIGHPPQKRAAHLLVGLLTYALADNGLPIKLCLPSFPVTDFRQRALIIGAYSGGFRPGFTPGSLVHPRGLNLRRRVTKREIFTFQ
jgi:hypothetical protein